MWRWCGVCMIGLWLVCGLFGGYDGVGEFFGWCVEGGVVLEGGIVGGGFFGVEVVVVLGVVLGW